MEIAVQARDETAVAACLAAGDSPMDLNHLKIPVLFDALQSNSTALLELLDTAGADWSTPYNDGGFTPLIYASLHSELTTVKWLVERGEALQQRTAQGIGVMHVAAQRAGPEIAQYLYDRGADPFTPTEHGESPLVLSLQSKHGLRLFRFLLGCYRNRGRSVTAELLPCLIALFKTQRDDAVEALQALMPLIEKVPGDAELRAALGAPENRVANPFRSLDATLTSRLSRALFALLKAERVARSCPGSWHGAPRWQGPQGL